MTDFLQALVAFILALSILVAFHEYGHFWVARKLGIRVLRFSIGFGRPLLHFWLRPRPGKLRPELIIGTGQPNRPPGVAVDASEFVIAALPIGGYVRMLDEREGDVPPEQAHLAFNRQQPWVRIAVVVAGPIANIIFAILAYWLVYILGVPGTRPVIGEVEPDSIAALVGMRSGDEIVAVAGRETPTWEAVLNASITEVVEQSRVPIEVIHEGRNAVLEVDFGGLDIDAVTGGDFFKAFGAYPKSPTLPAIIGEISPDSPAARAGLNPGDRVVAADGEAIRDWPQWVEYVRARPEVAIRVRVESATGMRELEVIPERIAEGDNATGRIGASVDLTRVEDLPLRGVERYGPITAIGMALQRTWDMSAMTLKIMWRMLFGEVSTDNLSGPISIASFASQSASQGIVSFLMFLAVVSVSLAVLNLLPIPLLDGGHLLFYLIESALGRPVPESIQIHGQQVGLFLLLGLMSLALYNDIMRII